MIRTVFSLTEARDMSMTHTLDPTNVYLVIQTCVNLSFAAGTMLVMLYNSHHSTRIIKLDKIVKKYDAVSLFQNSITTHVASKIYNALDIIAKE